MSTAKGDAFENRAYAALAGELQTERLCVSPKSAKIFRKKAYHSRDRGASIIADISIEVFLPTRERPSLVWVFECKDYRGSVPVDDVEEFHAKLQQIGEDNTKGTFVTSGAFQRSALNYARSKAIGVIRLLPDDQVQVLSEMISFDSAERSRKVDWAEFDRALTDPQHRSRRPFFGWGDGYLFTGWGAMLAHTLRDVSNREDG